ncbi:MAG: HEPN domain-containing protein [Polaromonas sp.]|uniref:HEPN domain-containing protein n=1 Tax=Polaromonas sp. TaxID=1869339 RepID=UPI002730EC04|nr:HEPN domain-containing protein [Polaromonas sp.]MDP2255953.1 HEPN domain-containing protein [Polaromonas sp.]
MLATVEIKRIASARLRDAKVLLEAKRYDGAVYLCGYSVELALKARICKTLKWSGYPETGKEFTGLTSFKVHDLDLLLRLTGKEQSVKAGFLAEWSAVAAWNPEARYKPIGSANESDAKLMLESASVLMKKL